jgi:dienelactone hydrolase
MFLWLNRLRRSGRGCSRIFDDAVRRVSLGPADSVVSTEWGERMIRTIGPNVMRTAFVSLCIVLGYAMQAKAQSHITYVTIPVSAVANARPPSEPLSGQLRIPWGDGSFPVVIVLHGCGGLAINETIWADRLSGWGYAALIVNSFAPRHVASVCAPAAQPLVTAIDRAGDAMNAAAWLRTVPSVDGNRIGVLGLSHGGGTAAAVTRADMQRAGPGLIKAAVDYYGPCRDASAHGTVPLLALAGEDDTWGYPARSCKEFGTRLRPDQPFEVYTYPGVVHGFDNPRGGAFRLNEGHPMQYNHAAAEDSYARVKTFLDRYVGRPGH